MVSQYESKTCYRIYPNFKDIIDFLISFEWKYYDQIGTLVYSLDSRNWWK